MAIRIMTDSASDISQELAGKWNITVLPLTIRFGSVEYQDGVTLSCEEFFEKLGRADELPKTSQITPYMYGQVFEEAVEAGDEVICFTLSSGVSGSYQSACAASASWPGKVTVIDTRQFCISERIIVERAVQLRDEGLDAAQLVARIRRELKSARVIAMFDTLKYLKMGGRLSAATAMAGTLLSIKPVLTIEEGVVKVFGKARGSLRGIRMIREAVEKLGIDFSRPVCLGSTGGADDRLEKLAEELKDLFAGREGKIGIASVGATIGTYAGPGAVAVAFFQKAEA